MVAFCGLRISFVGDRLTHLVAQLVEFVSGAKLEQLLQKSLKEALSQLLERVNDGKPVVASSVFSTWYVSQMELVKRKPP